MGTEKGIIAFYEGSNVRLLRNVIVNLLNFAAEYAVGDGRPANDDAPKMLPKKQYAQAGAVDQRNVVLIISAQVSF